MKACKHKNRFSDLLDRARAEKRPLILDGALGTELDDRVGISETPLWSGRASIDHPDILEQIHRDYVDAGAEVIVTSTFRTTEYAFSKAGRPAGEWILAARNAVSIAGRAAGDKALVAGSVAPIEDCFSPELAPTGDDAYRLHLKLINELAESGVDVLWLETFGVLGELCSAIKAARESWERTGIAFVVGITTNAKGHLISGEKIEDAFSHARDEGASAFNINCVPPSHVEIALNALENRSDLPIGVYANLGFPEEKQDWKGSAYFEPPAYVSYAKGWVERGVSIIGGCCGSNPSHVIALQREFKKV